MITKRQTRNWWRYFKVMNAISLKNDLHDIGSIHITVLFMQTFLGSNIFLGISHCYAIKIVDINCPMLFEIEHHGLLERNALPGKDYISNFLSKRKKSAKR